MKRNVGKTCKGATSLAELLVGVSIFMLFMIMLFTLYVYGYRSWKEADVKLSVDRETVVAMDEISRSLLHTNVESVTITFFDTIPPSGIPMGTPPASKFCAISMQTAFDTEGVFHFDPITGKPIWQGYFIYYINPNDKTLRKIREELSPPPDISNPQCVVSQRLDEATLNARLNGTGKVVARDVINFMVVDRTSPTETGTFEPTNPLCLKILVEKGSTQENKPEKLELNRIMQILN